MKMKRIKQCILCLVAVCMLSAVLRVYADSTSKKIEEAQDQVDESKKKIEEAQNEIKKIKDEKKQSENELSSLSNDLKKSEDELNKLQASLKEKQKNIEQAQKELEEATATEEKQYEDMKLRIKYMYEMRDSEFFEILLSGGSFSDILNRAEYFSKVTEYDRNMMEEYKKTKAQISQKQASLEQEKTQLEALTQQAADKRKNISLLATQTQSKIAEQRGDLDKAEELALEYEKQMEEQMQSVEALKEQEALEKAVREAEKKAREEAEARAAAGVTSDANSSQNSSDVSFTEGKFKIMTSYSGYELAGNSSAIDVMASIIYCESGGQPYEGKLAVGSVIMNRINSVSFPNTLVKVLFQKTQFTPVVSGRFAIVLETKKANAECYQAAQEVLNGTNNVPECLFFRTVVPDKQGIIIGGHVFY